MLIFRDKRIRDNVDPIPRKMPQLPRDIYLISQRALKSIWFGEPAPIQEAIDFVQAEHYPDMGNPENAVKEALAQYVNLIIRKIMPTKHDMLINTIETWEQERLRITITRGLAKLEDLRKEANTLSWEVRQQEMHVSDLRRRKLYLDKQEKSLTNRLAQLETNEKHVQQELERINGLHPVEVDRCLEIVRSLAKEANNARN